MIAKCTGYLIIYKDFRISTRYEPSAHEGVVTSYSIFKPDGLLLAADTLEVASLDEAMDECIYTINDYLDNPANYEDKHE